MIGDREITSHSWYVQLYESDGFTLGPKRYPTKASYAIDESWSPYGQASVTFPESSAPDLAALDPDEEDYYVLLNMTQEFGRARLVADISGLYAGRGIGGISEDYAGDDISGMSDTLSWGSYDGTLHTDRKRTRVARLMVRSRETDPMSGTVTLGLATVDAKLNSHAHVSATTPELFPPEGMTLVWDLVNWVLAFVGESVNVTDPAAETATFVRDDNGWKTGQTAWDYLNPLLQSVDLRLWANESASWYLMSETPTPLEEANFSAPRTLTSTRDLIDLDRTVTQSVLVTYRWTTTDSEGKEESHTAYDAATLPGRPSRLPFTVTYNRKYPGPGAAARILRFRASRSRAVPFSAVSNYDVTPGMRFEIFSGSVFVQGTVRAVTWAVPDDRMDVATRDISAIPEN